MAATNLRNVKWRGRIIRYAPLFLWIGVIFFLSSSLGAMSNTSRFIRPLLEWLFPGASAETLTLYHGYVRKFAHFAEYAVLGFLASHAFRQGRNPSVSADVEQHTPSRSCFCLQRFWYIFAFLLVLLIASIDEFNQSLNAMRTGALYDVLLDISGGLVMIVLSNICHRSTARSRRLF